MLIINADNTGKALYNLENALKAKIELEKLGPPKTFLGNDINIDYKNKRLYINQTAYTNKLLDKFDINISKYKPVLIPGIPGLKLRKNNEKASQEEITEFQKQIGSLLYLALKTRPDIAYSVIYCFRYSSNPNKKHFNALLYIWKYLLKFPDLGLVYNCEGDNFVIKGFADANYANNIDTKRSTTGYIFSLSNINNNNNNIANNNIISWNSQL